MKLITLLLLLNFNAQAQFKAYRTSLALTALQGLGDGFRDASLFGRMRDKGQWWNGIDSWQNKWRNGDPAQGEKFLLSSSVFAFTTDAAHFTNMVSNMAGECAKVTMPNMTGLNNWQKIKYVFVYSMVRSAAHNLVFGVVYRQRR